MKAVETLESFDAGIFLKRLDTTLKEVALGVVEHGKKGDVNLKIKFERMDSGRVKISHTIDSVRPTLRGKVREDAVTSSELYVNRDGSLSLAPEAQGNWTKTASVVGVK